MGVVIALPPRDAPLTEIEEAFIALRLAALDLNSTAERDVVDNALHDAFVDVVDAAADLFRKAQGA